MQCDGWKGVKPLCPGYGGPYHAWATAAMEDGGISLGQHPATLMARCDGHPASVFAQAKEVLTHAHSRCLGSSMALARIGTMLLK